MRIGEITIINPVSDVVIKQVEITIISGAISVSSDNDTNGPLTKSNVIDVAEGRNIYTHNLGARARIVQFYQTDTKSIFFEVIRDDGGLDCDEFNKIVFYSDDAYTDVEVNLIAY